MTDYIKREEVYDQLDRWARDLNYPKMYQRDDARCVIDGIPSADVAPVVRCKDCKWWTKQEKSIQGRCALAGIYPTGGWYCGNGERRDDEIDRR